jgi:arylsulfatase A
LVSWGESLEQGDAEKLVASDAANGGCFGIALVCEYDMRLIEAAKGNFFEGASMGNILRNVLMLCAVLGMVGEVQAATRPNVVLIFIDDMGYGDIGPFGSTKVRTPHLDRFAAEGMKFHSFYATPVCSMSRAALMTGCYNARVSMPGVLFPQSEIGLNPEETTVAELLKQQGYATICIGKWHLGHREPFLPERQGFDSYFGIPYSNDMSIDPKHAKFAKECVFRDGVTAESARGEAIKNTVPLMRGAEVVEYPADQATLTKRYTEEAVKFMREHRAGPFFVYLPHTMVHGPLAASDEFKGKSQSGLLGDAIEEIDWSVGQIMQTIKDLQIDDNTLVIFTSDNGPAAGSAGPWRGKKATNYEGGVREPCIMRWPGKIPAGTDCQQIAGNIDVLPTLAKIAGAPVSSDNTVAGRVIDGREITSLMFDVKAGPVRDVHLYYRDANLQATRKGSWKLFFTAPAPAGKQAKKKAEEAKKSAEVAAGPELYNLADDPYETKNVAAEHPQVVAELQALGKERGDEIRDHKRPVGSLKREKGE